MKISIREAIIRYGKPDLVAIVNKLKKSNTIEEALLYKEITEAEADYLSIAVSGIKKIIDRNKKKNKGLMDKETFGALKRLIFFLHKTPVKGVNGNDFVKIRDWIDEVAENYEN